MSAERICQYVSNAVVRHVKLQIGSGSRRNVVREMKYVASIHWSVYSC